MIPIKRLHYKLDMKLNKNASNAHQSIPVEDKDFALREAEIKLVKKKIGSNNTYGVGFDGFKKRYQDLEFLVVPHETIVPTKTKDIISVYSFELDKLKQKFFLPVDTYTQSSRGKCKGRIVWIEDIARHDDLSIYLDSKHHTPSFAYQLTFAIISDGNMYIYTEDKDGIFKVDKAFVSYLRYPEKVCFGGYEDFDGSITEEVNSEFPEHLEDEIIEIAVQDLALITENQFAAQAAQIRAKDGE